METRKIVATLDINASIQAASVAFSIDGNRVVKTRPLDELDYEATETINGLDTVLDIPRDVPVETLGVELLKTFSGGRFGFEVFGDGMDRRTVDFDLETLGLELQDN